MFHQINKTTSVHFLSQSVTQIKGDEKGKKGSVVN